MGSFRRKENHKGSFRQINQLLPKVFNEICRLYDDRPDLILASWPEVIGPNLAPMTQPLSFREGILIVKVKNSTLYSLLSQHEKNRLLQSLREKFPRTVIKTIQFRMG